jgi:hypothetical protein
MGVHSVELTPATLAPVLPEGEEEEDEEEEGDEKGNAQLAGLPEGLWAMEGEVRELQCGARDWLWCPGGWGSSHVEVSGMYGESNPVLKLLPANLGQLGALKQLTLAWLDGLEVLPDAVVRTDLTGQLDH